MPEGGTSASVPRLFGIAYGSPHNSLLFKEQALLPWCDDAHS